MPFRTTSWALAALALASVACATKPEGSLRGRPVVVILFDALSARHVHHLGYARETTPTLDHLASEGVSFAHAFAPAPYTLASIPSLMTGVLPDRHKVVQVDRALGDGAVTLAERLAASGYQTFGAVANIKGGSQHHVDQGFEVFEELYEVTQPNGELGMRVVEPAEFSDVLQRWTRERDPQRPPFFYLHVLQPHLPYAPPSPHKELWLDPTYDGPFRDGLHAADLIDFVDRGGILRVLGEEREGTFGIERADQDAITALYDANIHYADRALADMLAVLDQAGSLDEAL
ncbi:MAG: sulfatase-like hydrolase/transferase, partial [Planctomycetes bacterium]|nr:sulfatase-like hydrolase/transferase [Planctomycetota bacterium]